MEKILVATDRSENAKKAVLRAKEVAQQLNASVDIIKVVNDRVVSPATTVNYHNAKTDEELQNFAEELLAEELKIFDDFEGKVNVKLRRGDPADVIIREATEDDYDLVIMGSRGLGTFSRAMLGSVSNKVLNHIQTDVWVIK